MPHPSNRDIANRAARLLGVVAGGQSLDGTDATDFHERLQSVILDQPGLILRGRWCETAISDAYTAEEGYRVTVTAPGVVTLPTTITPTGGCTRPPLDFARVQILGASAANAGLWVYVATLAAWRQLDAIDIEDDFPFGLEDVDGMAAQLAVAIQDEFGANYQAKPRTAAKAAASVGTFRARFMKAQPYDWNRPNDYTTVCDFPDYC